jgi:[ribosomal protein S5]-alanine N-acetyltransferase
MELYTNDLLLRAVTANDIEEVARMWDFGKGRISTEDAQKAIQYMQNNHKKNKLGDIHHLCFAVFEKGKNNIIGWCGLDGKTRGKLHIFYLIDVSYRNKGYATQCAAELLSYAFDKAHIPFVNGGCDKNNIASYRVMEKIGMKQNAYEENGDPLFFIDEETYHKRV